MSKPVVVTISHDLSKAEAKSRIQNGLDPVRSQLSAFATSIEDRWTDDRLDFRVAALGQTVVGTVEVFDAFVRAEVWLPGVLGWLGDRIGGLIRQRGALMLEKK